MRAMCGLRLKSRDRARTSRERFGRWPDRTV